MHDGGQKSKKEKKEGECLMNVMYKAINMTVLVCAMVIIKIVVTCVFLLFYFWFML